MAQSLGDSFALSLDPRLIAQVSAAIYGFCETVDSEGTGVTGHTQRVSFATKITLGQQALQPLITHAVCFGSLSALSAAPTTDTQASNAVATLWNVWAGI